MGVDKIWASTNICTNKILASTKVIRWQNIGVKKILVSTKFRGWQNIAVDKILALRKYMQQQNVGACADYVQVRWSIFLVFWPGKVRSIWLLPDLADVLLLEDVVLSSCSHQVTGWHWPPRFYGQTLSALYRIICIIDCYSLAKISKILAGTGIL
jgi:hypothetical protein